MYYALLFVLNIIAGVFALFASINAASMLCDNLVCDSKHIIAFLIVLVYVLPFAMITTANVLSANSIRDHDLDQHADNTYGNSSISQYIRQQLSRIQESALMK